MKTWYSVHHFICPTPTPSIAQSAYSESESYPPIHWNAWLGVFGYLTEAVSAVYCESQPDLHATKRACFCTSLPGKTWPELLNRTA